VNDPTPYIVTILLLSALVFYLAGRLLAEIDWSDAQSKLIARMLDDEMNSERTKAATRDALVRVTRGIAWRVN
jgi:hypothetical protein